jgi:hypothetical protein
MKHIEALATASEPLRATEPETFEVSTILKGIELAIRDKTLLGSLEPFSLRAFYKEGIKGM